MFRLFCSSLWDFAGRWLAMRRPEDPRAAASLLLGFRQTDPASRLRAAALLAAAYAAHNAWRHSGRRAGAAARMLPQALREAVRSHVPSMQAVDAAFAGSDTLT